MLVLAVCCAGFGLADEIWLLDSLRFAQGIGAAIAWTGALAWLATEAPIERRGEMLGIAFAAAVTGALLGPRGEFGVPPLLTNPRAFAQATWRHALFGIVFGRLA
jgi:MFS family permease